jgi:hypothetical protein
MPTVTIRRLASASWTAGLVALSLVAAPAGAQSTWNFTDQSNPGACTATSGGANGIGNRFDCAAQGSNSASLRVQGYSISGSAATSTLSNAAVTGPWSGSGVGVGNAIEGGTGASSPNHALDNQGTGTDLLMLSFLGGAHNLRSVQFGWVSGDSDFQLLRWIGGGTPSPAGQTVTQFLSGWQLVGAFNGGSGAATFGNVNPTNLTSQYWAVASYNSALGGTATSGISGGNDAVKILSVTATPSQVVPEPSTYVLMGTGMVALAGVARRRRLSTKS